MTRSEKIEKIVSQIEDWDLSTLIDYAKDMMREKLQDATHDQLDAELESLEPL